MLKKIVWSDYPCEEAHGSVNSGGYVNKICPRLKVNRNAHVIACEKAHGLRPSVKHTVDHLCENKKCVCPQHLEWVTTSENHKRRSAKGRATPTKASDAVVLYAVGEVARGRSKVSLSAELGIDRRVIQDWAYGRSRSKLTGLVYKPQRPHVIHV